jgi:hypothetical protein
MLLRGPGLTILFEAMTEACFDPPVFRFGLESSALLLPR